MAKIYTKTGDKGMSSLVGGSRVSKADARLKAYGEIDEFNSTIGLMIAMAGELLPVIDRDLLHSMQKDLFVMGSHLACETEKVEQFKLPQLESKTVQELESRIDELQGILTPLKNFILPGGTKPAAYAQMARAICRRSERAVVEASGLFPVNPSFVTLLNRISDYLFVLGRSLNHYSGVKEEIWKV